MDLKEKGEKNMVKCAIYPRKSKATDNSQSMEQQVDGCIKYIEQSYGKCKISVYDGDYAITGHSLAKRKDFKRMMDDVKCGNINVVVIFRYDRIARNMRDFCNIFHELEENNCSLVSVSQQIDTTTPYGKNFMYQMAAMAELEWALTSERYKDMIRYKMEHGFVYSGRHPRFGFKIEKLADGKHLVHDREKETIDIFDYYYTSRSKRETINYVRENYDPDFTKKHFDSMIKSDLYFGKAGTNEFFCEPYFTKEYMEEIRSISDYKGTYKGIVYPFSRLVKCPLCGHNMWSVNRIDNGKMYYSLRCNGYESCRHRNFNYSYIAFEKELLNNIERFVSDCQIEIKNADIKKDNLLKKEISSIQEEIKRVDYMFEKGRLSIDDYDSKLEKLQSELNKKKSLLTNTTIKAVEDNVFSGNWRELYSELTNESKYEFWHSIAKSISVNTDRTIENIDFY